MKDDDETGWVVNGIHLEPLVPMKKWKVQFSGNMKLQNNPESVYKVNIDAEYTSDLEFFDFDSDMDPWTMARAVSRESWSREYFDRLKEAHQSHYEQFGHVAGTYSIDDGDKRDFKVNIQRQEHVNKYCCQVSVMRDHTHGSNRDWKLMHRYCLHNFTCEDGTRGFLGIVSQPGIMSYLELGYIYDRKGKKQAIQVKEESQEAFVKFS